MQTLGIIQARMSSTRLPGKVMMPILGEPMIVHQLRRTALATELDQIVVATSTDPSDDPLAELVTQAGFDVVRGSLDDVLARFVQVIDTYQPEVIVRMTADCPLISPKVIDKVVHGFEKSCFDYRSNTLEPTFPDGLDVETVRAKVLRRVNDETQDPLEREHVTLGIYRHPERYALDSYRGQEDFADLRWTVDTADDFVFVSWIYESLLPLRVDFDVDDVLELIHKFPYRSRTSADLRRNASLHQFPEGSEK